VLRLREADGGKTVYTCDGCGTRESASTCSACFAKSAKRCSACGGKFASSRTSASGPLRTLLAQIGFDEDSQTDLGPEDDVRAIEDLGGLKRLQHLEESGRFPVEKGIGDDTDELPDEDETPAINKHDLISLLIERLNSPTERGMQDPSRRQTILQKIQDKAKMEPFQGGRQMECATDRAQ